MSNIIQANKVLSDSEELNMAMRIEETLNLIAGPSLVLNIRECQNYLVTLTERNTVLDFINPLKRYNEYYMFNFTISFLPNSGNNKVSFKQKVFFPGNNTTSFSTTAGRTETLTFFSIDSGNSYLVKYGNFDTIL